MTEIEVVKMSLDLWQWLYKNPLKAKIKYPKYYKIPGDCPCCFYYQICRNGCPLSDPELNCASGNFHNWSMTILRNNHNIFLFSYWKNRKQCKETAKYIYDKLEEKYKELLKNDNKI